MQALAATVANVNGLMPDVGLVAAVLLAAAQSETLALHNESGMALHEQSVHGPLLYHGRRGV